MVVMICTYMAGFFNSVFGLIILIGGVLSICAVGVLYVAGLYSGKKDDADDRLIGILKETVDALEIKVNKQTTDIEFLTKKVQELERENGTLIEVLQGRDKATLEFQQQMLETVRLSMDTNSVARDTNSKVSTLMGSMGQHLAEVSKAQAAI